MKMKRSRAGLRPVSTNRRSDAGTGQYYLTMLVYICKYNFFFTELTLFFDS